MTLRRFVGQKDVSVGGSSPSLRSFFNNMKVKKYYTLAGWKTKQQYRDYCKKVSLPAPKVWGKATVVNEL